MKDIVANRKKIDLAQKLRLFRIVLRENGLLWTVNLAGYYAASSVADRAHARMHHLRTERGLPGLNSSTLNYEIWQNWDWESSGEEWTYPDGWKESLIDNILQKYMVQGGRILEIGPGAGRWTEILVKTASHLIAVDISDQCIDICKQKFAAYPTAEFRVNNGSELPFIESDSIDSIWSFDVFVHINAQETNAYLREFRRVLKNGGCAAIHHGATGGITGGWRSDVTAETFRALVMANGFTILTEIDEWRDGDQNFQISRYGDVLTVFHKPN
jgi:SAM-dependent methyltransferase